MSGFSGKVVACVAWIALVTATACLRTIPDASRCPADAVHRSCAQSVAPSPPAPPEPGGSNGPGSSGGASGPGEAPVCDLLRSACLRQERADCACRPDLECSRRPSTCNPPPDCPRSVTDVRAGARCIDTTAQLAPIGPQAPPCLCGCPSCSVACDGEGPVLGPDQVLRFSLPRDVPPSGALGAMVRMRGLGRVTVSVGPGLDGPEAPRVVLGEARGALDDLTEVVLANATGEYRWSSDRERPQVLELRTDAVANVEIDCVVPFYAR